MVDQGRRTLLKGIGGLFIAPQALAQEAPAPAASAPDVAASAPDAPASAPEVPTPAASAPVEIVPVPAPAASAPVAAEAPKITAESLFPLGEHDLKPEDLKELAQHIKSPKHEDWRLVAYTDPAHTPEKPIYDIGAGFNMSIPEDRVRGEPDDKFTYNGRIRKEPSSLTLWRAAGLPEEQFHRIIARVQERMKEFGDDYKKNFPEFKRLHYDPNAEKDISEEDAMKLLMISVRQAAYNAPAYCKDWKHMTRHQKMSMACMVYQMGANLEGFKDTLGAMNKNEKLDMARDSAIKADLAQVERSHWQNVSKMFSQSKWARDHGPRARRVLAWLDPDFGNGPHVAKAEAKPKIIAVSAAPKERPHKKPLRERASRAPHHERHR